MIVLSGQFNKGQTVQRYPWDTWFQQDTFTLVKKKDFTAAIHGMAQMIRNSASSRGIKVSLNITDKSITVTVTHRSKRK